MRGTESGPALASYRDTVAELTEAGEPFGVIEDTIDGADELTDDAKAALWLLAFSMGDAYGHDLDERRHLAPVG